MWVTRFIALTAPPWLLWTGAADPLWEQLILGAIWMFTLQIGLQTAYHNGRSDAWLESARTFSRERP